MKKKRAYTLIETLMSSGIFAMLAVIGLASVSLITWTLYSGQTENTNRSSLNETVYFLTREIQSAEAIKISDGGKVLEIKERGKGGYNLKYSLVDAYPVGYLAFRDKKLFDADAHSGGFSFRNGILTAEFKTFKNGIEVNQQTRPFVISIKPRCAYVSEAE